MTISLYVHVPFCVVKCGYCDFNSYEVRDRAVIDRFLGALDRELSNLRPPRIPHTVFVGGGTPTFLEPDRFEHLLEILRRHIDIEACREVTLEANPESLTLEKAKLARAAGVTRASVGAQSFDEARLRFLDRAHDAGAIRRAVTALRTAGFDNVSLDLIFGLPGQTLPEWESDLREALALEPDHLSCYHLSFEPGTRLTRDLRQGKVTPNDETVDERMFHRTREFLEGVGFVAYEVSNFAGRGGPCLHNDHYWLQGEYLGAGPGAASHRGGWRGTNLKPVESWATAIERGLPATGDAEFLTPRRRLGEAIWLGLRRTAGVDLDGLRDRLGIDPTLAFGSVIERFVAEELLAVDGSSVRLTRAGLPFGDVVGSAFL